MNLLVRAVRKINRVTLRTLNIDTAYSIIVKQEKYRVKLLNELKVDLVADVGANIGQYAHGLFERGFTGDVISFEPVSDVYEKLLVKSKPYNKWMVYERCAIGEKEGETEINVSKNYESSSIYNVLEKSVIAEPSTSFIRKEKTRIAKLSDIPELQQYKRIHLKIDVQGYEEMVLKGAEPIFDRVTSLELEISLVPLYDGALLPETLLIKLKEFGFMPAFYTSAFTNNNTGAIMQLDGLFVKRELLSNITDQ